MVKAVIRCGIGEDDSSALVRWRKMTLSNITAYWYAEIAIFKSAYWYISILVRCLKMRLSLSLVIPAYWYAVQNNMKSELLAYWYALRTGYWYAIDTRTSTLFENKIVI